jgi:polysaccharide chain length determinant protein (PEP-CTERM system associated)
MINIPKIEIQPYLIIAWRRKWWIITPLLLSLCAGGLMVVSSPKMYKASTLILVESQRVPSSYVQSTISEDLSSRLNTITQQVNSRTNLESIIKKYGLFASSHDATDQSWLERIQGWFQKMLGVENSAAGKKQEPEPSMLSLVEQVRKKINVQLRGGNRAFEISFEWKEPQMAADVANTIASQFIEQNLKVREEMAMGTTDFLETEVERIRRDLIQKEQELERFKQEHMGSLPSQLDSNLNVLSQLKEERNNLEKRIEMEKQQLMMLRNQIATAEQFQMPEETLSFDELSEDSGELSQLREALERMRFRYTEEHPDVRTLKRRIAKLEEKEQSLESEGAGSEDFVANDDMNNDEMFGTGLDFSPQAMYQGQISQVQARINNYEQKIEELTDEIDQYRERVEATSKVELQLKDLERDYAAVNDRYQALLSKKLSAEMSEEMEKRQKGEQFRVVDPAVAPSLPFKPDVQKIMIMALALGLGLGGGLAYLKESLDPGFYTQEEIEAYLDTEVVVSFPIVESVQRRKRKKIR